MCENKQLNPKSALEESIMQFASFFEERIKDIATINVGKSNNLFQKTLYAALLDALSKTVTSPMKGNRERIISLIRHFSQWEECNNVSLPHLIRLLEKNPDPEFSQIRAYVFSLYDKWTYGAVFEIKEDPKFEEIRKLWPANTVKAFGNIRLEAIQHVNLFYEYRNSLVHELRELGYGMEFKESDEPFYHSMQNLDSNQYSWEMVYPIGFYEKLCRNTLSSLKEYYLKERIDPYSAYQFGSYWIRSLNQ